MAQKKWQTDCEQKNKVALPSLQCKFSNSNQVLGYLGKPLLTFVSDKAGPVNQIFIYLFQCFLIVFIKPDLWNRKGNMRERANQARSSLSVPGPMRVALKCRDGLCSIHFCFWPMVTTVVPESYPLPETPREGCTLYDLHVQVALPWGELNSVVIIYRETGNILLETVVWVRTFLFFNGSILTICQGTGRPVAQTCQTIFISAKALSLGSYFVRTKLFVS